MRLHQLDHFVAIVDAGSIRAASRAQGVSHPAMTKSLRLLEDDLGVPLLRRSTRGVVCTPAGRALLARARVIRAEVTKAEQELAQWSAPHGGAVSVGLSPIAAAFAPDAVARFLQAHPQARLRIVEGPPSVLVPLVRDETLDFAVVVKMPLTVGAGLKFRPIASDRMAVACRPTHPLRKAKSWVELADARWLGLNALGAGGWLEHTLSTLQLPFPRHYVQCESFAFAFEIMSRIDALMAVAAPVLAGPLSRGLLVEVPLREPPPAVVTGLCTRAEGRSTPLATTLARALADVARDFMSASAVRVARQGPARPGRQERLEPASFAARPAS
jgi:DNA-binding transcriptional LysR family regulator